MKPLESCTLAEEILNRKRNRAVNLYLSSAEIRSEDVRDSIAVVIDVLRASTSIVTALHNGARSVIPVAKVETARSLAVKLRDRSVLLCGERNEMIIDGFDLSNSPMEYTNDRVRDKTIVFTSTNGAQLFDFASNAAQVLVGAFVNVRVLSEHIAHFETDVALLCAGKNGRIGLEDVVCGGMIVDHLVERATNPMELNDGAIAAKILYQNYAANIMEMLYQASHGKRLIEIGQEHDLKICGSVDAVGVIPVLSDNELILL
ncbi:MAG TPA: 2-phosphosulfolactate phosphatase [bacterium]